MKPTPWTRACLALVFALSLTCGAAAAFSDTTQHPNREDMAYVAQEGLFFGVTEDRFAPEGEMTRGMAVTALGRLAKTEGAATDGVFADVADTSYYAPYVGWAVSNELIGGVAGGRFAPKQGISRDEFSALLDRFWSWLGRVDGAPQWVKPGKEILTRGEAASAYALLSRTISDKKTTTLTHRAADGVTLTGKLDLPATGEVARIVLFVNGSGPNTFDNKRVSGELSFNYFDLFAQQLTARGVGFFRWNTRGVSMGDQPPLFADIDEKTYQTYLPQTSVSDIGEWITALRQDPRLKDAEILLLGWSEGTIIAPLAAKAFPKEIDGLLLAGYCNDRMDEILDWQQTGGSSMVFYNMYFDANGDGAVSKAEFDADPYQLAVALGAAWDELDVNRDGSLTREDFRQMLASSYQALKDAVARGDDDWMAQNYGVRLTTGWFNAHGKLAPNRETLPQLSLPIAIFHGTADGNCDVGGVYAIEKAFQSQGKTNLSVQVYPGYDHDLNYLLYPMTGAMPQAFEDLFQRCVAR